MAAQDTLTPSFIEYIMRRTNARLHAGLKENVVNGPMYVQPMGAGEHGLYKGEGKKRWDERPDRPRSNGKTTEQLHTQAVNRGATPAQLNEATGGTLAYQEPIELDYHVPLGMEFDPLHSPRAVFGYGHNMTSRERTSEIINGIQIDNYTPKDFQNLLDIDVDRTWIDYKRTMREEHGVNIDDWTTRQREMGFDVQFTTPEGMKAAPEVAKALASGDYEGAAAAMPLEPVQKEQQKAQFFTQEAKQGEYSSPKGQEASMKNAELHRQTLTNPAKQPDNMMASREQLEQEFNSKQVEIDQLNKTLPPEMQGVQVPMMTANTTPAYAPNDPAAPAGTPLVPQIDLGGMLSKEYVNPATGVKGEMAKGLMS